jgi:hypothetical protein
MGKISYENFKNISKDLKFKNTNLDKIRNQCMSSVEKDTSKNGFGFQKTFDSQKNE